MRILRQHDDTTRSAGLTTLARGMRFSEMASFGLAGISLGVALIVGVHYIGQNADAHTVNPDDFATIAAPITMLHTKEDPLMAPPLITASISPGDITAAETTPLPQQVARAEKGDMLRLAVFQPPEQVTQPPAITPPHKPGKLAGRLFPTPPIWKLEQNWRLAREQRVRVLQRRKKRLRELACLAKAVYFEARSESLKGQMAVAKVVLNRVRNPRFPNTVCGVVYQGAERRNACQFSFACDGKPDYPTEAKQWRIAKRIAAKALRGQIRMRQLDGVDFYHADYVRPTWASMMRPVIKIGRHIFYRDS